MEDQNKQVSTIDIERKINVENTIFDHILAEMKTYRIKAIINKPITQRTSEEVDKLVKLIENLNVIKNLTKMNESELIELANSIKYEVY